MAENILTDAQKRSINRMVAQAFQEDLNGRLIIDLESFRKQIDTIIKQMNLSEVSKKWVFLNHTARKNSLALRGYLLIFKFRQFLLEEEIDYLKKEIIFKDDFLLICNPNNCVRFIIT